MINSRGPRWYLHKTVLSNIKKEQRKNIQFTRLIIKNNSHIFSDYLNFILKSMRRDWAYRIVLERSSTITQNPWCGPITATEHEPLIRWILTSLTVRITSIQFQTHNEIEQIIEQYWVQFKQFELTLQTSHHNHCQSANAVMAMTVEAIQLFHVWLLLLTYCLSVLDLIIDVIVKSSSVHSTQIVTQLHCENNRASFSFLF